MTFVAPACSDGHPGVTSLYRATLALCFARCRNDSYRYSTRSPVERSDEGKCCSISLIRLTTFFLKKNYQTRSLAGVFNHFCLK